MMPESHDAKFFQVLRREARKKYLFVSHFREAQQKVRTFPEFVVTSIPPLRPVVGVEHKV